MPKDYDDWLTPIIRFVSVVKGEPGFASLFGVALGMAIREIVDFLDVLKIWLRKFLIGERRK